MTVVLLNGLQKNGMQPNPDKFHLILLSPTPTKQQVKNYAVARFSYLKLG